jgi:hypothetical protein
LEYNKRNTIMTRSIKLSLLFLSFFPLIISCGKILDDVNRSKGRLHKIFNLPDELSESSGMIIYNSLLWTFNDSENEPDLYGINTSTGEIVKIIHIINAENVDWEDISQDESRIYIGDIGNSSGNRDSLRIYIINKTDISGDCEQNCTANKINFVFANQVNFNPEYHATSFDCESLISVGDSLYVFTKDWINFRAVLYSMPKISGSYAAKPIVAFNSEGLVTGASYELESEQIALCGYNNYIPFILLIDVSTGLNIDDQMINRFEFIEFIGLQIEGIDYSGEKIYLTSENSAQPQAFFEFKQN